MIKDLDDLENTSFVVSIGISRGRFIFISEMLDLGAMVFSTDYFRGRYYELSGEEQSDNFIVFEWEYHRKVGKGINLDIGAL